jgi:hypothetical protein
MDFKLISGKLIPKLVSMELKCRLILSFPTKKPELEFYTINLNQLIKIYPKFLESSEIAKYHS